MHKHHSNRRYHIHGTRVLFWGVALLALCFVRFDATALTQQSSSQVLAYATNINRGDLLAQTNAARAANGLAPLTLNSQLNTSSQNKAQHMITYNYWAHVAPDGTQPWYFFDQAGYAYQAAGENLAYGFDSSAGTVTAWMNSPSHRDNILGNYVDVGFGIANGDNYQGAPNTVVVAHYGRPQYVAPPAPAPAPTPAPAPAPAPTPAPAATSTPEPAAEEPKPEPETAEPESQDDSTETAAGATDESPKSGSQDGTAQHAFSASSNRDISLFGAIAAGNTPTYGIISLVLLLTSAIGFVFTHRALLQHALVTSEAYVIRHPMVDIAAVGAISLLVLSSTVSHI